MLAGGGPVNSTVGFALADHNIHLLIMDLIFLLIGILLAAYVTVLFVRALIDPKGSFLSKLWQWVKGVLDALSGIG